MRVFCAPDGSGGNRLGVFLDGAAVLEAERQAVAAETAAPASWWTTRAMAGEVTAGFSKAEILKADPQDPRGASGVFTRVGGLLSDLLG